MEKTSVKSSKNDMIERDTLSIDDSIQILSIILQMHWLYATEFDHSTNLLKLTVLTL